MTNIKVSSSMKYWYSWIFFIIALFLITPQKVLAGGIHIHEEDLRLNGYPIGSRFRPRQSISMTYTATDYSFSGEHSDDHKYYIFFLDKKVVSPMRTKHDLVFIQLARSYETNSSSPLRYTVEFLSPSQDGIYELKYHKIALFSNYALGHQIGNRIELDSSAQREIKKHLDQTYEGNWIHSLGTIKIGNSGREKDPNLIIYLRLNDRLPTLEENVQSGVLEKPVKLSWRIEQSTSISDIKFRYQLYPDDEEWSKWMNTQETYYFFINKGQHEFRVEGKYKNQAGTERLTPQASYSFTLNKAFIAKPILKTSVGPLPGIPPISIEPYSGSKALIVGIAEFNDKNFGRLPYIKEDLIVVENSLKQKGFDVKKLEGAVTREQIFTSIEQLVSSASKNERLIIYFSAHGFKDSYSSSEGYIASTDCDKDNPTVNCVSLDYLDTIVKRCMAKPVKHVLIIVDSCFSGLGVLTKNHEYPDVARIAEKPGSHMITAGMAEQLTQMDHRLRQSTFTYFLGKGLSGEADYTGDDIITLTELFLFVQYEVAKQTAGSQIPMIGRISGQGEIIFDKRPNVKF